MTALAQTPVTGLPDACAEAFAFAIQLRRAKDPGAAETLRNKVEDLLASVERRASRAGIESADIESARYALTALIDEIVLGSNWPMREEWAARPLQLVYFDEFNAGVVFYDRLEALRGKSSKGKLDLLEVYATCLGLGFRGQYADIAGTATVRGLMSKIAEEIRVARGHKNDRLSPSWEPAGQLPQKVKNTPVWIVAAICGGVLILLFVCLDILLGWHVSNLFPAV